jgi:hypothetical protein
MQSCISDTPLFIKAVLFYEVAKVCWTIEREREREREREKIRNTNYFKKDKIFNK